jgi:hypothetical protein
MGQFEHALGQEIFLVLERGENSEKVGRCNARVGHLACKEDTLPKRSEGVDVKKFVVLCMSTGSWKVEKNELVNVGCIEMSSTLDKHDLVSDKGNSEGPTGEHYVGKLGR